MDDRSREPREQVKTLIAIVLTFASGATDVVSFTHLGGVFTSVMTGNIVLLGLAVAHGSVTLATHTAASIGGYIAGVAGGTWIARGFGASAAETVEESRASGLPPHVIWALFAELILMAGFALGWELSGANPAGWEQFCLLPIVAAAIGMQSSTVNRMNLSDVGTTYLTGTLTTLVASLVSPAQKTGNKLRRFGVLFGLAAGAGLSGLLIKTAAAGAPALQLAALGTALVLATGPARWQPRLSPPPPPGELRHGQDRGSLPCSDEGLYPR